MGFIRLVGNIIWIFTGGIVTAIGWLLFGALLCITIVGIPFGLQCFKFARVTLAPFGKKVNLNFKEHMVANTIWAIIFGWIMALSYLALGLANIITIIGIPFGIQSIKFAKLGLLPFGAVIQN